MADSEEPVWPSHTARQVRLTCIDDRLLSAPFAEQHGAAFEVRLAGGALALTDERQGAVLGEFRVPQALGHLDAVWLEMHLACGAVGLAGHRFDSIQSERAGLERLLAKAEAVVRDAFPGIPVRTRLVTPTGASLPDGA